MCRATRVSAESFSSYFWGVLSDILPRTLEYRVYSQEFYKLALSVFRTLAGFDLGQLDLNAYIRQWGTLILYQDEKEVRAAYLAFIGDADDDRVLDDRAAIATYLASPIS